MEKLLPIKKVKMHKNIFKSWQLYLLLLPAVIYLIIFAYAPISGIILSFKDYDPVLGIIGSPWVGFEKFKMFFSSYYFKTTVLNTLIISVYSLVINTPLPIIFALLINEVRIGWMKKAVQTITYAPYFISVVVLVGMCFSFFALETGVINKVLSALGFGENSFMTDPAWFKTIYVFSGLWQGLGWWSIIYVGTLSNVDPALHEAATIDGATRFKRMIHINLPAIIPTATIMLIMSIGAMMSVGFEKVYLMQTAGTISASEIIATYAYKVSFVSSARDFSFGTAVGLFNSVINLVLLFGSNFISKKLGKESLW